MTIYTLYKKTHRKTGLQYLGKTTRPNPYTYAGSGIDWVSHLKEFGRDFETEILLTTTDKEELIQQGRYYSDLWNIVESKEWANRIPETGGGTGVKIDLLPKAICCHCQNSYAKKYIDIHQTFCKENSNRQYRKMPIENCMYCKNEYPNTIIAQHTKSCQDNPNRIAHHNVNKKHDKKECPHCYKMFGIQSQHEQSCYANPNRVPGPRTGKTSKQEIINCNYCNVSGGIGNMKRSHGDNCHMNPASDRYNPNKKVRRKKI
jgi:hypothetical protein